MTPSASGRPALLARLRVALSSDPESQRLRRIVANDGIIATAGILEGFAGAGAGHHTLLVAGTVATIAGMLAAGGSEWAEIAAEREAQLTTAQAEAAELARDPPRGSWPSWWPITRLGECLPHSLARSPTSSWLTTRWPPSSTASTASGR